MLSPHPANCIRANPFWNIEFILDELEKASVLLVVGAGSASVAAVSVCDKLLLAIFSITATGGSMLIKDSCRAPSVSAGPAARLQGLLRHPRRFLLP